MKLAKRALPYLNKFFKMSGFLKVLILSTVIIGFLITFYYKRLPSNIKLNFKNINALKERSHLSTNENYNKNFQPSLGSDNNINSNNYDSENDNHLPIFKTDFKIVHLDLKGAAPKVSYLKKYFPYIKKNGATGVLMEYEDMFPYQGKLKDIRALNSYTISEIMEINSLAVENNLEIIPLVPTFGHLEFVLKYQKFSNLREIFEYPQAISACNNESIVLIHEMIDQMLKLHPKSKFFHIGGDEVYNHGESEICREKMATEKILKSDIFLQHISKVANYILDKYHKVTALMWDDMFRNIPSTEISEYNLNELIEIVVWNYGNVLQKIDLDIWNKYSTIFGRVWIASAYKGAENSDSMLVEMESRLNNHRSWLEVYKMYNKEVNFVGIILTGWQRFDHFAVLCELLPTGIPSLVSNLYLINHGSLNQEKVRNKLDCESIPPFNNDELQYTVSCNFPGSSIFEYVQQLYLLRKEYKLLIEKSELRGWLKKYNIDHNFSQPQHIVYALFDLDSQISQLNFVEKNLNSSLSTVFDDNTVSEWFETYVKPLKEQLNDLWEVKKNILKIKYWPRRPLTKLKEKT